MSDTQFTKTPGTDATNNKIFTLSFWTKRTTAGDGGLGSYSRILSAGSDYYIRFENSDQLKAEMHSSGAAYKTNMLFQDNSAWYHIVWQVDTSQAVAGDRVTAWVNGVEVTSWAESSAPSQDHNMDFNKNGTTQYWGSDASAGQWYNGYFAQICMIDGTTYAAAVFGSTDATTGEWKPKSDGEIRSAVNFGNNGYLLSFENASNPGYDYQTSDRSGTTNDFSKSGNGYKTADNPSDNQPLINNWAFKVGMSYSFTNALQSVAFSTSDWASLPTTLGPGDSGKWYFEAKQSSLSNYAQVGFMTSDFANFGGFEGYFGQEAGNVPSYGYGQDGKIYYSNTSTSGVSSSADWETYTSGDICMCALDLDNNFVYFGKNGTWGNSGDPTSGATGTGGYAIENPSGSLWVAGVAAYNATWQTNFGNGYFGTTAVSSGNADDGGLGTFEYDVPTGYRMICSKNIKTYG